MPFALLSGVWVGKSESVTGQGGISPGDGLKYLIHLLDMEQSTKT
jgi:hypothetical protein